MTGTTGSSHTIRALTELRKRILSGDLQGGARLLEVPLAEMLQISRTPVREAMSRLAEEGLLERGRSGGFVVRAFGVDDVVDAIELRGVLEGTAARLAAERGADEKVMTEIKAVVAELDKCFDDLEHEIDFDNYSRLNAEFHDALSRLAGSKIIAGELERVTRLPFASPSAFLRDKADLVTNWRSLNIAQMQHFEIVAAVANRQGSRAEALARDHAHTARRDLDRVLKQNQPKNGMASSLALIVS